MKKETVVLASEKFKTDVRKGLTAFPKYLSSKYFYDEKGDKLFQKIMDLPEYYLTRSEFKILKKHKKSIVDCFYDPEGFDFIELGAGDGKKTKILLRELVEKQFEFNYLPIDINYHSLAELENSVLKELPQVRISTLEGTYFAVLGRLAEFNQRKKVIMVLGSNIGNLRHKKAVEFLQNISQGMNASDLLFMGFDQKKHPQTILDAYNDKTGITAAFNKNILHRINRELGADFQVDNFMHWETYNPESGTAKSFLVSKIAQKVYIEALELEVNFKKWESIHVEISQKYDDETVEWLVSQAGLKIKKVFTDDDQYYKNYLFSLAEQG